MRQRRAVLVHVLASGAAVVDETVPGAAPVQERHETDVGGSEQCEGRQVGDSIAEKQNRSGLGERVHGHAGRTVPGWSGDLWHCAVDTVSGECGFFFS